MVREVQSWFGSSSCGDGRLGRLRGRQLRDLSRKQLVRLALWLLQELLVFAPWSTFRFSTIFRSVDCILRYSLGIQIEKSTQFVMRKHVLTDCTFLQVLLWVNYRMKRKHFTSSAFSADRSSTAQWPFFAFWKNWVTCGCWQRFISLKKITDGSLLSI